MNWNWLKRLLGVRPLTRGERDSLIVRMYKAGSDVSVIARAAQVSYSTIYRVLKEQGVMARRRRAVEGETA